jgi:hypothetical protein
MENIVQVGTRVRVLSLFGKWLDELPADEKDEVLSMIGEVFEVEELTSMGSRGLGRDAFSRARGMRDGSGE